jgi:sodium-dependent dicarboxylate transporter 2/3/5
VDESNGAPPGALISPAEAAFERRRRAAGAFLAPAAFALLYLLTAGRLTPEGQMLAAILGAVVALWVTEALPLPVTALVGAILSVVLGVAPARQVLAYFADPIVFLFIGSFMLARAMMIHRLDRRMALSFLAIPWVSARPARLLAGVGLVTAALSMWVSNTATTAMMLPIGLGILGALHQIRVRAGAAAGPLDARAWPFATGMLLMVAYAASIGGVGTPVGSPPNLIGIGLIRTSTGIDISFFTWMAAALPLLLAMMAVLFVLLYLLHRSEPGGSRAAGADSADALQMRAYIDHEKAQLGPWTRGQTNTLVAFGCAVSLWMLPGALALLGLQESAAARWLNARMPEAVVALLAAVLLFLLPARRPEGRFTITWEEAVGIDWGTILLFGGGLALGTLMFETGVATAMGEALAGQLGASSLWGLTFASIAVGIILSETTSNTAAANMVIPVAIAIAEAAGVSPVAPALGACFGASYGFMLPVSTPPNAIVYGSGLVPIPRMMRAGIVFDVLGLFIIWIGLRVMCPLLGLV